MLKQVFLLLFFFIVPVLLAAQQPDSMIVKHTDSIIASKDSIKNKDTAFGKYPDTSIVISAAARILDSINNHRLAYSTGLQKLLGENQFLNSTGMPGAMEIQIRKRFVQDNFFYLLCMIGLIAGFLRFFYIRYFNNLFRVFFNASLRQNQLTDQLLQAKLPSLLFNILFVLSGGIYVYLLLRYGNWVSDDNFWVILFYCTLSLGVIYLIKNITLKFTGWLTGYETVTNTYVFIIFLINKILGIILLPFSVIIAFSIPTLASVAVIISLLLIGLMFLLRFFRSYGLLQNQLKVSKSHFFMYVLGIEILPVLLIYKGLVLLLSKNL